MKTGKIFIKITNLVMLALAILLSIYFIYNQNSLSGSFKDTYLPGLVLFGCILGLIEICVKTKSLKPINFNKHHPERKEDEVFIYNTNMEIFNQTKLETKRAGEKAYTRYGKEYGKPPYMFPVFAKISEVAQSKNGRRILKKLLP